MGHREFEIEIEELDALFGGPLRIVRFNDMYPKGVKLVPDIRSTEHVTIIGMEPVTVEEHQRRRLAIQKNGFAGTFGPLD